MSDDRTNDVIPYSAFLERRARRHRVAEDLAGRPSEAVVPAPAVIDDETLMRTPQAYRIERPRRWWLER